MKILMSYVLAGVIACSTGSAFAQETMQGDQKDACEALLCLTTGSAPSECTPPLRRYFSIRADKPSDERKKRRNFLKMCPSGQDDLVDSIVGGKCNPNYQDCTANSSGGAGGTQPGNGQQTQAR
ncbi:TrbM/KikA/MpfK family conjugal transfer protein [Xanthomonas campestris pv. campestris]|nr:TrbM/KikA/MpfK family conjugal transfer protein [Xanthomonas campestris pv. campestris]MEB1789623.1 TrbM/KikA/MpfK family conjugal transfer protein [Xanthomonas campestris pv. campestris]MEB1844505.1 TrbM/KikA/MpfK family conjugal transfer protein [Xanthomonas campestris pv. campestris]MEB1878265.1 TrbM/KikA/MpfK family conjugal transfer protein [Xanthomonas campestris pv. campestris]